VRGSYRGKTGLKSDETLRNHSNGPSGSEYPDGNSSQPASPSLKSLIKAKHAFEGPGEGGLKESIKQNMRKVKGTTSIKNLIRSAATRD